MNGPLQSYRDVVQCLRYEVDMTRHFCSLHHVTVYTIITCKYAVPLSSLRTKFPTLQFLIRQKFGLKNLFLRYLTTVSPLLSGSYI